MQTITLEEARLNIGKKVTKTSPTGKNGDRVPKPFKSTFKVNTVKDVIIHPILNIPAYTFEEDESYVECRRCVVIETIISVVSDTFSLYDLTLKRMANPYPVVPPAPPNLPKSMVYKFPKFNWGILRGAVLMLMITEGNHHKFVLNMVKHTATIEFDGFHFETRFV